MICAGNDGVTILRKYVLNKHAREISLDQSVGQLNCRPMGTNHHQFLQYTRWHQAKLKARGAFEKWFC
jgi:hypothetical protein